MNIFTIMKKQLLYSLMFYINLIFSEVISGMVAGKKISLYFNNFFIYYKKIIFCDNPKHYVNHSDLINDVVWLKNDKELIEVPMENLIPFQKPATPAMEGIIDLHHDIIFLFIIILTIVAVILFGTMDMHYMETYLYMRRHYFLYHLTSNIIDKYYDRKKSFFKRLQEIKSIKDLGNFVINFILFWGIFGHIINYRHFVWIAYIRNFGGNESLDWRYQKVNPNVFGSHVGRTLLGAIKRSSNIGVNFLIETIWTLIPLYILIIIAIPSFALLYGMDELAKGGLTIKAIGHQWYWSYEISDEISFGRNYLTYEQLLKHYGEAYVCENQEFAKYLSMRKHLVWNNIDYSNFFEGRRKNNYPRGFPRDDYSDKFLFFFLGICNLFDNNIGSGELYCKLYSLNWNLVRVDFFECEQVFFDVFNYMKNWITLTGFYSMFNLFTIKLLDDLFNLIFGFELNSSVEKKNRELELTPLLRSVSTAFNYFSFFTNEFLTEIYFYSSDDFLYFLRESGFPIIFYFVEYFEGRKDFDKDEFPDEFDVLQKFYGNIIENDLSSFASKTIQFKGILDKYSAHFLQEISMLSENENDLDWEKVDKSYFLGGLFHLFSDELLIKNILLYEIQPQNFYNLVLACDTDFDSIFSFSNNNYFFVKDIEVLHSYQEVVEYISSYIDFYIKLHPFFENFAYENNIEFIPFPTKEGSSLSTIFIPLLFVNENEICNQPTNCFLNSSLSNEQQIFPADEEKFSSIDSTLLGLNISKVFSLANFTFLSLESFQSFIIQDLLQLDDFAIELIGYREEDEILRRVFKKIINTNTFLAFWIAPGREIKSSFAFRLEECLSYYIELFRYYKRADLKFDKNVLLDDPFFLSLINEAFKEYTKLRISFDLELVYSSFFSLLTYLLYKHELSFSFNNKETKFSPQTIFYLANIFSNGPVPIDMKSPVIRFDSYMLPFDDLKYGQHRMYLSVTKALVVPLRVTIRLLVTSVDVLHSWAVPSLGIKLDAAPGRLNQTCLYLKRHGSFYGQCSELCGINHAFMPIHVKGVRLSVFLRFLQNLYLETFYSYQFKYVLLKSYIELKEII